MDPVRAISLAALCLLALGAVLWFSTGEVYSSLFLLPAVAAAAAYSLAPQLRWWYWQRHAPDLPTELAPLLDRFALYRRLGLAGKREFRRRTFLLREATHFIGKEPIEDRLPEDVRIMAAASAATVTFHREDFLLKDVETVVFYLHHFPSPQHDRLHAAEFYAPDGAIIYVLNVFLRSCVEPDKYLQLGYYEYGRALLHVEPELRRQLAPYVLDYPQLEAVTGFPEAALRGFVGLEELDRTALTTTVYHSHREAFAAQHPEAFAGIDRIFAPAAPPPAP